MDDVDYGDRGLWPVELLFAEGTTIGPRETLVLVGFDSQATCHGGMRSMPYGSGIELKQIEVRS